MYFFCLSLLSYVAQRRRWSDVRVHVIYVSLFGITHTHTLTNLLIINLLKSSEMAWNLQPKPILAATKRLTTL